MIGVESLVCGEEVCVEVGMGGWNGKDGGGEKGVRVMGAREGVFLIAEFLFVGL